MYFHGSAINYIVIHNRRNNQPVRAFIGVPLIELEWLTGGKNLNRVLFRRACARTHGKARRRKSTTSALVMAYPLLPSTCTEKKLGSTATLMFMPTKHPVSESKSPPPLEPGSINASCA